MMIFCPELKPVPPGATQEDRQRMYDEYCAELRRLNPQLYRQDGSLKRWWQVLLGF